MTQVTSDELQGGIEGIRGEGSFDTTDDGSTYTLDVSF